MAKLMIEGSNIVPCPYIILGEDDEATGVETEALSMEDFLTWASTEPTGLRGVVVEPGDNVDDLAAVLERASFIAISFPKFSDGRGYSHSRRLRKNMGYEGPIVSFGDVLRDQLMHMQRCGMSAYMMREDQDLEASLEVFERFPAYYQKAL